jgi:hypothetical protein
LDLTVCSEPVKQLLVTDTLPKQVYSIF